MTKIIEVNNISKHYRLNSSVTMHANIRNYLRHFKIDGIESENKKGFWALKNISFEMMSGEVLGIVGRNGAGKSTLLKILSQITSPTSGKAKLNGRVGSLLEVGTGFHPELSGRENVYFNGTILGLSKKEIKARFDEIVDFSGVEKFIDTPIKRYSSGMKMRLAFSVAAHLDPEILIVDEVLAVGDADFQRKCINKMQNVSSSGRTILFVSHNSNTIKQLCTRCITLKNGMIEDDSTDVTYAINKYLQNENVDFSYEWRRGTQSIDFDEFTPLRFRLRDSGGATVTRAIASEEEVFVEVKCEIKLKKSNLAIGYAVYDSSNELLYYSYQSDLYEGDTLNLGYTVLSSQLPPNLLNDGEYTFQLIAGVMYEHPLLTRDESNIKLKLRIEGGALRSSLWIGTRPTTFAPVLPWHVE